MKKTLLLLMTVPLLLAACGTEKQESPAASVSQSTAQIDPWQAKTTEALLNQYHQSSKEAWFANDETGNPDAINSYFGLLASSALHFENKIDKNKLNTSALLVIESNLIENHLSSDLTQEMFSVRIITENGTTLDHDVKAKIKSVLDAFLQDDMKKGNPTKLTSQARTSVHFNYITIMNLLNLPIDPPIKQLIQSNLDEAMNQADEEEKSVIKALYFDTLIRKKIGLNVQEQTLIQKLAALKGKDGGYGPHVGYPADVTSTRMAVEIKTALGLLTPEDKQQIGQFLSQVKSEKTGGYSYTAGDSSPFSIIPTGEALLLRKYVSI